MHGQPPPSPPDRFDGGLRAWSYLPLHALRRLGTTWRLLRPFLRHPFTALSNLRYTFIRSTDAFDGTCLGIGSRREFIAHLDALKNQWVRGELSEKPRLWLFQAYCEKPLACACHPSGSSPYYLHDSQKRFNEFCVFHDGRGGRICGGDQCRIGELARSLAGRSEWLDIELKIMLEERQMSDFWREMLHHQARTGTPIPFVMDLCPFAYWLARRSLFQLKSPLGVIFFFQSPNRCTDFTQYLVADRGRKDSPQPVTLGSTGITQKDRFLRDIATVAGVTLPSTSSSADRH